MISGGPASSTFGQYRGQSVDRVVDLVAGDDDRRGEAERRLVRLLDQDSAPGELVMETFISAGNFTAAAAASTEAMVGSTSLPSLLTMVA